jgi:predicted DNA-binding transcriptional regulator YafY
MAKRDFFIRYLLVIRKLRSTHQADFGEISDYIFQQSVLLDSPIELNIRTFQRDLNEIRSIFGIDVKCDRRTRRYYISDDFQEGFITRMLEAIDVFTSLTQLDSISSQVIFEKGCTRGSEFIFDLLQAIKQKRIITIVHQKYSDEESTLREVEPYALKEFKDRWYLFARDLNDGTLKTFGLDRVQGLAATSGVYASENITEPMQYFKDCFGIIRPTEGKAEEILLSMKPEQAKYIKSYPLHESQEIIEDNVHECVLRLKVFVTYDLVQEIMSMGDMVKVIAPTSLKKELLAQARNIVKLYGIPQ